MPVTSLPCLRPSPLFPCTSPPCYSLSIKLHSDHCQSLLLTALPLLLQTIHCRFSSAQGFSPSSRFLAAPFLGVATLFHFSSDLCLALPSPRNSTLCLALPSLFDSRLRRFSSTQGFAASLHCNSTHLFSWLCHFVAAQRSSLPSHFYSALRSSSASPFQLDSRLRFSTAYLCDSTPIPSNASLRLALARRFDSMPCFAHSNRFRASPPHIAASRRSTLPSPFSSERFSAVAILSQT